MHALHYAMRRLTCCTAREPSRHVSRLCLHVAHALLADELHPSSDEIFKVTVRLRLAVHGFKVLAGNVPVQRKFLISDALRSDYGSEKPDAKCMEERVNTSRICVELGECSAVCDAKSSA